MTRCIDNGVNATQNGQCNMKCKAIHSQVGNGIISAQESGLSTVIKQQTWRVFVVQRKSCL